jgi:diacylglycerol kinase family enzyme/membrane-associated phospholipid phosphatase
MRTSEHVLDPTVAPAVFPVPQPIDRAVRLLSMSANHGRLWMGVAAGLAMTGRRGRRAAIRGMASLGAASLVSNAVIKPLVGRRRPDIERTAFGRRVSKAPWTSSFPSGHAASAAAFAAGASMEFPPAATVLVPLGAAVGYSRVHVGVHHRSDVWAGAAVGVGMAVLGRTLWPVKPWGPALMAAGSAPALPGGAGLTVVVNEKAGSADDAARSIARALPAARILRWDPDTDLDSAIGDDPMALGVAGGDGTVASVAQIAHRRGLPLAVFPAGTLNHFAKAVGLDTDVGAATAVQAGTAGMVDLATIDGTAFLNTASIGGYPQMVRRRDRHIKDMGRWPATAYALWRTLRHEKPLDLEINGTRLPVWVVFIGNGRYTPRGLAPSWREQLAGGVLDVQYVRADRPLSRTRAVLFSTVGMVERSRVYGWIEGAKVSIVSHSGPKPAAHDGEITDPVERIELAISDRRLTVYRG